MDEICSIASKDKAIAKAKLTPLVFISASLLCVLGVLGVLGVSASLWRLVRPVKG